MNSFTIRDLENLSGIKAHTIRIWEQRYDFLKPHRTTTNIRYYSNEELKTLLAVALLNRSGYKISAINKMSPAEMKDKIDALARTEARQDKLINDMIASMVDLDIDAFEAALDTYIDQHNVEDAITQLIFPFLERIGILWVADRIRPVQEHLVTNIIRQKLIAGIEATPFRPRDGSALLFLPEGEQHELGLLFVFYLLRKRGIHVFYLGADTPVKDLEYILEAKKPDLIFSHLTSVTPRFRMDRFLEQISRSVRSIPVIVSGSVTQLYKKQPPANVRFGSNFDEVMEMIKEAV